MTHQASRFCAPGKPQFRSAPRVKAPARLVLQLLAAALIVLAAGRSAQALEFDYTAEIAGVDESTLHDALESASALIERSARAPATVAGLQRRADRDIESLTEVLRAEGYYAGTVSVRLDETSTPIGVTLQVTPGPLFLTGDVAIRFERAPPEAFPMEFDAFSLDIEAGAPATAARILDAEQKIVAALGRQGFPLAQPAGREVVVDHALYAVSVTFTMDTGPFVRFGAVTVEGLEDVHLDYVHRRIAWTQGWPYDSSVVEKTRRALTSSRLFSSVRILHGSTPDERGWVPMTVRVVEGKPRAIGAGAGYATDEGLGGRVFWEHRNLFGKGERFRTTLEGTQIRRRLAFDIAKPDFFSRKNALVGSIILREEELEAFDNRSLGGSVGVERQLIETVTGTVGVSLERSLNEDELGVEGFTLMGFPFVLSRDTTDDLLNPTRGGRTVLTVTPYIVDLNFVTVRLRDSIYWSLTPEDSLVSAFWGSVGAIYGEPVASLPPDKRFYAGGGGSVRGYGFQLVGPVDSQNDPTGGRSVLEFGTELRIKVTESIGLVPFVEGGNVFEDTTPHPGDEFFWGAGLGFRYYTDFGPLRLDVGFPLDRRNAVDDSFQFYVSLGQAF